MMAVLFKNDVVSWNTVCIEIVGAFYELRSTCTHSVSVIVVNTFC